MTALKTTGDAIALGLSLKGDEVRISELRRCEAREAAAARRAMDSGDLDLAMQHSCQAQLHREAAEAATGTGGIGQYLARMEGAAR